MVCILGFVFLPDTREKVLQVVQGIVFRVFMTFH